MTGSKTRKITKFSFNIKVAGSEFQQILKHCCGMLYPGRINVAGGYGAESQSSR